MISPALVLLQSDPNLARDLRTALESASHVVYRASSLDEVRTLIAHHRAAFALIDSEAMSFRDVSALVDQFPATIVICTHRLADEHMWTEALSAGAQDIFCPNDVTGILQALRRSAATMGAIAA